MLLRKFSANSQQKTVHREIDYRCRKRSVQLNLASSGWLGWFFHTQNTQKRLANLVKLNHHCGMLEKFSWVEAKQREGVVCLVDEHFAFELECVSSVHLTKTRREIRNQERSINRFNYDNDVCKKAKFLSFYFLSL